MAKTVVDIQRLAKYAWVMASLSPAKLYHYRATIMAVYDGDTFTAAVDLGFKVTVRGEKIRLSRINAPEIRGANRKAGLASRDFLRELILGREVLLQNHPRQARQVRPLPRRNRRETGPSQRERERRFGSGRPRGVCGVLRADGSYGTDRTY